MTVPAEVRERWRADAVRGPWYGTCQTCGRSDDPLSGRRLSVARQARRDVFECVDCFAGARGDDAGDEQLTIEGELDGGGGAA